jgi:hypothetical protein
MLQPPNVPPADRYFLPPDEHDAARGLSDSFYVMRHYVEQFGFAVSLFEECRRHTINAIAQFADDQSHKHSAWMMIAARDAAMSFFHFSKAMEGANGYAYQSKTIAAAVDSSKLGEARDLVRDHFPRVEAIRHAVAHTAEITKNRRRREEHAFSGSFVSPDLRVTSESAIVLNHLAGCTFRTSWEGKIISFDVNNDSYTHLIAVCTAFFSAFPQPLDARPTLP